MLNETAVQLAVSRIKFCMCLSLSLLQSRVQEVLADANATFDQLNGPNGTLLVLNVRAYICKTVVMLICDSGPKQCLIVLLDMPLTLPTGLWEM